ncbi:PD-(D/E)XK nuclease-like domain-containing protein [Ahrensia sp. R2A130]|uniref:PD-(D/E)XK nuclease-like domain-containing protein n=1 Tax=Ahrensia sp. R2A130 TaxID=744979 RepID=UPI0001E0BCC7|nr:PD-(D/E)XK nuclease-like domain-containing protein [Ahrensia sp. R2A130]EFL88335.1 conserved hypothetical protein [Ahrensia sp. R2A130]
MTVFDRPWDGLNITAGGMVRNLPMAQYHSNPYLFDDVSVSKSSLANIVPEKGNPKAFWAQWLANPNRIEGKTSDALDFGKSVHTVVLNDGDFGSEYAVRPDEWADWKTQASRDWRVQQQKASKTVLEPKQIPQIMRMYDDARTHPAIQQGILNGKVERTVVSKDATTGIWLKSRPDVISEAVPGMYVDLKTVGKMEQRFISNSICDFGYYLQAGLLKLQCAALDIPFESFTFVFVSTGDVADTQVVDLTDEDILRGEMVARAALDTIARCRDAMDWPGAEISYANDGRVSMNLYSAQRLDAWVETSRSDNLSEAA